jgi:hypothetical protein
MVYKNIFIQYHNRPQVLYLDIYTRQPDGPNYSISQQIIYPDGNQVMRGFTYTFDSQNNITRYRARHTSTEWIYTAGIRTEVHFYEKGRLIRKGYFTFDKNGLITSYAERKANAPSAPPLVTLSYTYEFFQ